MTGVRRAGLVLPSGLALAGFLILIALGTWQVERKAWKEALISTLSDRLAAEPIDLPPPSQWPAMTPENSEFRRVRLHADYLQAGDALVYASGSSIRDDVKGTGYFVFSPAQLADGAKIVINRGFTPSRAYPRASAADIVGAIRWPEAPSWFAAPHDNAGEVWTVRDQRMMAQVKDWGGVAPFYIEQESPIPPGGLPHPAKLTVRLRNDHLQYAITWYGLAATLSVIYVAWILKGRHAVRS